MSGRLSVPLLEGDVHGSKVRFFASPTYVATRQPDMPWHSVDDLWPLVLDGAAETLRRRLRSEWEEPRTVATADGIVTIAPHFMAEGLFEAAIEAAGGDRFTRLRGRYRNCCTQAMKLMTAHLDPVQRMMFAVAATR